MPPHTLIANDGLFWDPEFVHWGAGSNKGHLLGSASANGKETDFREQRGFYALYHDYELLYIGQAGAGNTLRRARLQKGLRQSDFPDVSMKEVARIESGEVSKPRAETLTKICDALGTRVDELEDF